MRRTVGVLAVAALVLSCADPSAPPQGLGPEFRQSAPPVTASSCPGCVVNRIFVRATGTPVTETIEFAGDPAADYVIDIDDNGSQGAAGSVTLNGHVLLGARSNEEAGPRRVLMNIELLASNRLVARLTGRPGSQLTIRVLADAQLVGAAGGEVSGLGGSARVIVPAGALGSTGILQLVDEPTVEFTGPDGRQVGSTVRIELLGASLLAPATVVLRVPDIDGNGYADGDGTPVNLVDAWVSDDAGVTWTRPQQAYDSQSWSVEANATHFSLWALAGRPAAPRTAPPAGFVSTNGTQFMLNGSPFRFAGANAYYLPHRTVTSTERASTIQAAVQAGFNVVRISAYEEVTDTASLASALEEVQAANLRAIVTLVDNWDQVGWDGMDWYTRSCIGTSTFTHDQFYTNQCAKSAYSSWALQVVRRFRGYPGVFAWELANEPRCDNLARGASATCPLQPSILAWMDEMSNMIAYEDPAHMISGGEDGFLPSSYRSGSFYGAPSQYWSLNAQAVLALPAVSFGTFHLYTKHVTDPVLGTAQDRIDWGVQWIRDHRLMAQLRSKPVILEEFGLELPAERPCAYAAWTNEVAYPSTGGTSGVGGWLLWIPSVVPRYSDPEYSIDLTSDPAGTVLRQAAAAIRSGGPRASCSTQPAPGLVAFYPLDGNGNDASGNANHGVVSGATAATGHTGLPGTALSFAGSSVVTVPSNPIIKGLTSDLTLVYWVRRGATPILEGMLPVSRREFGNRIHFLVYSQPGGFAFECCSSGGSAPGLFYTPTGSGLNTLNDGQWHQVAVTRHFGSGGVTKLYLDGAEVSGTYLYGSASDVAPVIDADFLIGRQASLSNGQFSGFLDDVSIYNTVLTQAQIQALYVPPAPSATRDDFNGSSLAAGWQAHSGSWTVGSGLLTGSFSVVGVDAQLTRSSASLPTTIRARVLNTPGAPLGAAGLTFNWVATNDYLSIEIRTANPSVSADILRRGPSGTQLLASCQTGLVLVNTWYVLELTDAASGLVGRVLDSTGSQTICTMGVPGTHITNNVFGVNAYSGGGLVQADWIETVP